MDCIWYKVIAIVRSGKTPDISLVCVLYLFLASLLQAVYDPSDFTYCQILCGENGEYAVRFDY